MLKVKSYKSRPAAWGNTQIFFQCEYKGKDYRGNLVLVPVQGHTVHVISNSSDRALSWNSGVKSKISQGLVSFFRNLEEV
tara:strand:+ start:43 stop:282 length:240 start_codon:yes stop_codon:yes gene_type:complete